MTITRRLRKLLGSQEARVIEGSFQSLSERFSKNNVGVKVFYIVQFMVFFIVVRQNLRLSFSDATLLASDSNFLVHWIYSLFTLLDPKFSGLLVALVGVSSLFLVLINETLRWPRFFYAISLFVILSANMAMGITQINNIIWLWLAGLFCFLPSSIEKKSREYKARYNLICFSAVVVVLSCYSLSGFWKLLGAVILPFFNNDISLFNPDSLSYLISNFIVTYRHEPVLAKFAIQMSVVGQLSLWFVLYLQLFAVFAAFRSQILVPWLAGLVLFHLMNLALLNLSFELHAAAVLFVGFAFTTAKWPSSWRSFFYSLPLLRLILTRVFKFKN